MTNDKLKIVKSTKNIFENARDVTVSKLVEMTNQGVIKLDRDQLTRVIQVVQTTLDNSYQNSIKFHEREITNALEEASKKK